MANIPSEFIAEVDAALAAGGRTEISAVSRLFERAASLTRDPDLGLRAALFVQLGDFEVLEWVATSAATWREANETVCRYVRVLNDAADYRLEVCGDQVHLILGSSVPLDRVVADFQVAAYALALRLRIPEVPPELETWFKHPAPTDLTAYRAVFSEKLVFGAAFDGFVSDAWRLDTPLPTAQASMHGVLRAHADHLLQALPPGDSMVQRVSADIVSTLRGGTATATRTAARLGMTRRTLTRRLAQRGTTYLELLKEQRYRTAVYYLRHSAQTIEDIAFLLGFAECSPFARAFKRWSGHTPLEYRRLHARSESAM